MMPNFIEVDRHHFYTTIWPQIKSQVDSLQSNWAEVQACRRGNRPPPELYIHWGYKDHQTNEKIIVAVSTCSGGQERHWISPTLS